MPVVRKCAAAVLATLWAAPFIHSAGRDVPVAPSAAALSNAAVSLASEACRDTATRQCEAFCRSLKGMPQSGQAKALEALETALLNAPFAERSYSERNDSMSAYCRLVDVCCRTARPLLSDEGAVWTFRLSLVRRINEEMERCEREPKGGPYGDVSKIGFGPFMTQRQYLSRLRRMRFDMVRDGFEESRFSAFFHGLSDSERKKWQESLERVAHRRVVVWNPRRPDAERPRYEEEDTREWLPQKSPDEPRRYVEHLGGGRKMVMTETDRGMEARKTREERRRSAK